MSISSFWNRKRVFITGHSGFKGSWLSLWLQMHGAEVGGYALPPTEGPNLYHLARVGHNMTSIFGDITDSHKLSTSLSGFQPDIVFHLAAQPLVRYSYIQPIETFNTNVMGTVHLLEAARQCESVKVVVNVTSDKCYDNPGSQRSGFIESDPMGGHDPYSSSKGCAELVTSAYRNSFYSKSGKCLASVRAGNVIGGGDWSEDRIIPDYIRSLTDGKPMLIRNPDAVRPWQHVLDPLSGYLLLAQRMWEQGDDYSKGWNFGPNSESVVTVKKLINMTEKIWPNEVIYSSEGQVEAHEAALLTLNSTKANRELGWKPRLNVDGAVAWTIQWYKAYAEHKDMGDFSAQQIKRFDEMEGV
ncbi:CDP-glucose 4,6-dehydratase [Cohnella lupini]|uniref:CDP-glucose 4,6-dehydratase n=1 Tax=Cohnella lupini TaxID=1294267 RepID=A0A3D9I727_9BACL|nr:CDP-glucose 4,6-dehydratase [Cohnella lupini]RED57583.1 CDP-glucose 4,6-dehydratase [Cohnella lupini]